MTAAVIVLLVIGILTVILAGFTLIVGKENKTSEFRQAWIDDQRADLATAIAAAFAHCHATRPADKLMHLEAFDEAHARIELRENPSANEWAPVRTVLDEIRRLLIAGTGTDALIGRQRTLILDHARIELKKNWQSVKQGETFFAVFKWVFVGWLAVLGLTLVAINGISAYYGPYVAPPQAGRVNAAHGPILQSRPVRAAAGAPPAPKTAEPH
jgi:hypothetical protein